MGALAGWAHVASLSWCVGFAVRGRFAACATLSFARFATVAFLLVLMARLETGALVSAAGALGAARASAIVWTRRSA